MSRAYIYKVTVHATPTISLGNNRNVYIEEDFLMYFNTALAAQEFSDSIFDQYGWKCSFVWDTVFEDSRQGMKDANAKFDDDLQTVIDLVTPKTLAA
jgi:hypothetical protein